MVLKRNIANNILGAAYLTGILGIPAYLGEKIGDAKGALITGGIMSLGMLVQYLRGGFPFIKIRKKEYWPLQWITEHEGPMLEGPGTSLFPWPLVKRARKGEGDEDKPAVVSAQFNERDSSLKFRSENGLEGMMDIQYLYEPANQKGAYKYFWELDAEITKIDEVVQGKISEKIGNINGKDVAKATYLLGVIQELNNPRDQDSLYEKFGIQIGNLRIKNIDFDERSQKILSIETEAIEEARATNHIAEATKGAMIRYVEAANIINPNATPEEIEKRALHLYELDNTQQIAQTGKANIITINSPIPVRTT